MHTDVVTSLRAAYDGTAGRWSEGPGAVYGPLADRLAAALPEPVSGSLALDAGAGGGAVSAALLQRGARVLAVDLSVPMLLAGAEHRPPAVAGDIGRLPLRSGCVDLAAAAFVLSHVPSPAAALAELRRVTRRDGWVLASAFPAGPPHPAKTAVEEVAAAFGYRRPEWYERFKASYETRVGTARGLSEIGAAAGLSGIAVIETTVDLGELTGVQLAAWRLDMPHLRAFVSGLTPTGRRRLVARARAALGEGMALRLPVLLLRARSG